MAHLKAGTRLLLLAVTLFLVSWRASTPSIQRVLTPGMDPFALLEVVLAGGLAAAILSGLRSRGQMKAFAACWRGQPFLIALGVVGLLSVAWSVSPGVSFYKWAMFALATLVGSYLGFIGDTRGLLRVLSWTIAAAVFLSVSLAILLPPIGRMPLETYDRVWRGVFWHRNHLGIMAGMWSVIPLYLFEDDWRHSRRLLLPDGLLYLACAVLVVLSRSATGLIVLMAAACLAGAALVWQRYRSRISRSGYFLLAGLLVAAILMIALNFQGLLGILGRESSLTGRVPMWQAVLREYVSTRPVLGFGLGAFWNLEVNRTEVQALAGWPYPVAIGDNGWMDVLLGLGAVGLGILIIAQVHMMVQCIRRAWRSREFADTLPLVFLLLVMLANLSFSLFFETEAGLWLVLLACLFLPRAEGSRAVSAESRG